MNRDCNKCIHHTSGACSSWDCEMLTLEDYKAKVIDEFAKKYMEELEKYIEPDGGCRGILRYETIYDAIHEVAERMKGGE